VSNKGLDMKNNKFRTIFTFSLFIFLAFSSCKNMLGPSLMEEIQSTPVTFENSNLKTDFSSKLDNGSRNSGNNSSKTYEITGSITKALTGAVPESFYDAEDASSSKKGSRSAFPENPATVYYKVIAENQNDGSTVTGIVFGNTFSITLSSGMWDITAYGYSDSARTKLILSGTKTLDLTATPMPDFSSLSIQAFGCQNAEDKGSVRLGISVTDTVYKYVTVSWTIPGELTEYLHNQRLDFSAVNTPVYFTTGASEVAPGEYKNVKFEFFNSADKCLFRFFQTVNVYSNLETNTWVGAAPYFDNNSIKVTKVMSEWMERSEFYVDGTSGNDTNSGSFFYPFQSLQFALNTVQSMADSDHKNFTIDILSDLSESVSVTIADSSQDFKVTINGNNHNINYGAGSSALISISGTVSAGNPVNTEFTFKKMKAKNASGTPLVVNAGPALSVNNVNVNIVECELTGGNTTDSGAFEIKGASLIVVTDTDIKGGYYGIYCEEDNRQYILVESSTSSNVIESTMCGIYKARSVEIENYTVEATDAAATAINAFEASITSCIISSPLWGLEVFTAEIINSILDSKVKVTNVNSFSAVLSGHIKLKGSATEIPGIYLEHGKYIELSSIASEKLATNFTTTITLEDYREQIVLAGAYTEYINKFTLSDSNWMICSDGIARQKVATENLPSNDSFLVSTKTYAISTRADMETLREWVNNGNSLEGMKFILSTSIDLGSDWTPIGEYSGTVSDQKSFSGTFDGNGNSLKFSIDSTNSYLALFSLAKNATIKNLTINGSVKGTGSLAGFVGLVNDGSINFENCTNNVDVEATGAYAAGFVARATGSSASVSIKNCINNGKISSTGSGLGGFVGIINDTSGNADKLDVSNCINNNEITGNVSIGGIVGVCKVSNLNIVNVVNLGVIDDDGFELVGKFDSSPTNAKIDYCYVVTADNVVKDENVSLVSSSVFSVRKFSGSSTCFYIITSPTAIHKDVVDSLNNWITDFSLGNDATYATYRKWVYDSDGYPNLEISNSYKPKILNREDISPDILDYVEAPTSGTFNLTEIEELTQIAQWVNSGKSLKNVTLELHDDIDITSGNWTPIGNASTPFEGTFKGSDYSVKFNHITGTNCAGLFGHAKDAYIENVNVEGAITATGDNVGGLVGLIEGDCIIDNCKSSVTFTGLTNSNNVGGLIGCVKNSNSIVISNCMMNNVRIEAKSCVGGILGYCDDSVESLEILNCGNQAEIIANSYYGGILGKTKCTKTELFNCVNHDLQTIADEEKSGGKIAGYIVPQENNGAGAKILNLYVYVNNSSTATFIGSCNAADCLSNHLYVYSVAAGEPKIYADGSYGNNIVDEMLNPVCVSYGYTQWQYDSSGTVSLQ